jgi:hypothetical protein
VLESDGWPIVHEAMSAFYAYASDPRLDNQDKLWSLVSSSATALRMVQAERRCKLQKTDGFLEVNAFIAVGSRSV